MWQEKNMVRQYGQNKMKNIREISVGAILYRHFYFLKVSPKQRPYEDPICRIGEKDIHMQAMVDASDIGLKKIIRSHTEAMEMVQP